MRVSVCPFARPANSLALRAETLSARLRVATRSLHEDVEARLGLPETISDRSGYIACLRRFDGLYRPIERGLRAWPDWEEHGLPPVGDGFAARLAADLACLEPGAPAPDEAPGDVCPALPSFAHALGARYVLEGATLGGEVILRHLTRAGVDGVASACAFFGAGRGTAGRRWREVRAGLDRYGRARPEAEDDVVSGAVRTFRAVGEWLQSSQWRAQ